MPDIDLEKLKGEALALLKEEAGDLWDGAEDEEFLKDLAKEIAGLRFKKLTAKSDEEREKLKREIRIVEATIGQRVQQKMNRLNAKGQSILPRILGVLTKVAVQFL